MSRKNILISISLVAIIVSGYLAFYLLRNRLTNENKSVVDEKMNLEDNQKLPAAEEKAEASKIAGEIYKVILKEAEKNEGLVEYSLKDKDAHPVILQYLMSSFELQINQEIGEYLHPENYRLFFCNEENDKGTGIVFGLKSGNNSQYYAGMYADINNGFQRWENDIFSNFSKIFSPSSSFQKNTKYIFRENYYTTSNGVSSIKIRYANLKDTGGKELSIDYALFNEEIYVSSNKDCLKKMLDKYADLPE